MLIVTSMLVVLNILYKISSIWTLFIFIFLIIEINICVSNKVKLNYNNYYNPSCVLNSRLNLLEKIQEFRNSQSMIFLGPGEFLMGSTKSVGIRGDKETPQRRMKIPHGFWIDRSEVTAVEFGSFVNSTSFSTTAQILGSSFKFFINNGWKEVEESWRNYDNENHPVVHVSYEDARAYCTWMNKQLPNEAQWEYACRGGFQNKLYPWGDELKPNEKHMANIWQGKFPYRNTKKDGFKYAAPVGSFPPNPYGLFDMVGNVWEWVDQDFGKGKIQKGGSFLCHRNHCWRYRCGARTKGSRDSTASNLGFRCIALNEINK